MSSIANLELIGQLEQELYQEYDMKSRIARYESSSPQLIELAKKNGIEDITQAGYALFLSDFIITSSEMPSGISDDERRVILINLFKVFMAQVNDAEVVARLFYLSYKLGTQLRRTDSFLSGRGIELDSRAYIMQQLYVYPYLIHTQKLMDTDTCSLQLAILLSALNFSNPQEEYDHIDKNLKFDDPNLLSLLFATIRTSLETLNSEVNDNVVLPNIGDSQIFYVSMDFDKPIISSYNSKSPKNQELLNSLTQMMKFFKEEDEDSLLLYLRGRVMNEHKNLIFLRDPDNSSSVIMMKTPAEEVNVSELMSVLQAQNHFNSGWLNSDWIEYITKESFETVEVEEEDWVNKEVKEQVEVPVEKSAKKAGKTKKKKGFFARLFSIFGGGDEEEAEGTEMDAEVVTETKTVSKTVQEKVVRKVKKKVPKKEQLGYLMPEFVSKSLGILALSDLRLFEMFDTIRESEYQISGALYSNFNKNRTEFLATELLEDPQDIASLLDGLDDVIEGVSKYALDTEIQVLPTEMVFLGPENTRYIITMDGNIEKIVGTIAQTYQKDITKWQQGTKEPDTMVRRSLHMRTGQLLSSLSHTPFDTSVERIFKLDDRDNTKIITLEHAILRLD